MFLANLKLFSSMKCLIYIFFYFNLVKSFPRIGDLVNEQDDCNITQNLKAEIQSYQPIVNRIIQSVTKGPNKGKVWDELASFVDKFGPRIAGSQVLEESIDYMINKSIHYNLDNVHGENVIVPHFVRGHEEAILITPRSTRLSILGLGGSIGTQPEGITAEVLVVETFEELRAKAKEARNKIVVFAQKYISYGETVKYRSYAAVEGAKVGALATLVRSVTPFSIYSPHTGWQDYSDDVKKIPTASITVEDALMLLRMYRKGENITIKLTMKADFLPPVTSRNTISEIKGSKESDKVVIVSGHLDSWDVGNGAMDDGGGAFISWYSLVLLKQLGLIPRRTIRAILWTAEEEGLIGAFAYANAHDSSKFNLLMESDEGTFTPEGLFFSGNSEANCIMKHVLRLLKPLNATILKPSEYVGSDIMVWKGKGVPMASLKNRNEKYFWFHHSNGDRMTVENSDDLDKCVAVWASVAYVISDLSVPLPR